MAVVRDEAFLHPVGGTMEKPCPCAGLAGYFPRTPTAPGRPVKTIRGPRLEGNLAVLPHGPVVKLQVVAGTELPAASRIPVVSAAVNRVFAASVALGFRVATRVRAL
jgi:hypothetical protein